MLRYFYLLSFFSFISFISWCYFGIFFIINITLIFYIIDLTKSKDLIKKFLFVFPFFIVFNVFTTFWLYESDKFYSLIIFFTNSLIMTFFFLCGTFSTIKNKKIFFIIVWLISEWILTKWDLSWPWLIFGNVLSNQWYFIQWYSFTGVYGGSLWLLLIGFSLYKIITKSRMKVNLLVFCFLFIIPISSLLYYIFINSRNENSKSEHIVIYNPQKTKIEETNYNKTRKMLSILNNEKIRFKSKIIVPELFFMITPYDITDGNLHYLFKNYIEKNEVTFIIGSEIINDSVNKFNGITIISNKEILFRTKKKYVPIITRVSLRAEHEQ